MTLTDLTREYIRRFADSVIFERGEEYFENRNVTSLEYDKDDGAIIADVSGNYGDYSVEVYEEDGKIRADCDCPYDGYPCKHIVAVMLEFVEKKGEYVKRTEKSKTQDSTLKARMAGLSKEKLLEIIMDCAKKYPDFKSELMVRFAEDKQKVLDAILKQIENAFPDIEDSYSMSQIAKRLRTIAKQVDTASDDMKVNVYWAIADRTLEELNEYGIDDEILEGVAIDYMRDMASLLKGKAILKQKRQDILEELMEYYEWGNCGIVDSIYETVKELLEDKSDYQIVINHLEKAVKSSNSSYKRELLANLYEKIGDNEASLRTLESNLHYGMDYWRLAQYWIGKRKYDKVLEVVKEGLEKGEGRKDELYQYMREHHEKHKDYDALLALFKSKINDYKTGFYNIGSDKIYKSLMHHYESISNYNGIVNLLELRLAHESQLDFKFYQEAKSKLTDQDWSDYEGRFIAKVKSGRFFNNTGLLAEIYDFQGNTDELWKVVKGNSELLKKYEDKLFPKYSEEYLEQYKRIVEHHIKLKNRESYREAAKYAERIKRLYCKVLKENDKWETYIQNLRIVNKSLRAMQDEFSRL
jgi:uncharacterized Zn finger protein